MNRKILIASLILMAIVATSFIGTVMARPLYKVISVEKAQRMIFSEADHDLVVIDLRGEGSYDSEHIPGAINVPVTGMPADWTGFEAWMATEGQNYLEEHRIIVHCVMGRRSLDAAQKLIDAGFKKVDTIEGGFNAWLDAGYPTEGT